jgi:ABC-type proline/glycine betaine transport system ATPase subunit
MACRDLTEAQGEVRPGTMGITEVLLIGGRSGAGKSTVGREVSAQLRAADVGHALIEGDLMDQVYPLPEDDPDGSRITEGNLAAVWANFAELGCCRLVYTNTACVLASETGLFERAVGAGSRIVRVLLTASDDTIRQRLATRELGSGLHQQLRRSAFMARRLEEGVPEDTVRVATEGRTVAEIARDVIAATGW